MFYRNFLFFAILLFAGTATMVAQTASVETDGGPIITMDDDIHFMGPNPADLYFEIKANSGIVLVQVEMFSPQGDKVRDITPNAGWVEIGTSTLPGGTYSLRITTSRAVHTTLIVVQHP